MAETWTLPELVAEVAQQIAALPAPKNGQVRAVPDERTIRYYGTIGLLDRPAATRGRTALYNRRHLAQVVAIKRLQHGGRSLAEIQVMWSTLDDSTLARMSGVAVPSRTAPTARSEFWKREPAASPSAPVASAPTAPVELRVELAPNVVLLLSVCDESVAISSADIRAIRAAAAPLVDELTQRKITGDPR